MEPMTDKTSEVFMEITRNKMEQMDEKITAVEEKINKIPDSTETIQDIKRAVDTIMIQIKSKQIPLDKLQDLSNRLEEGIHVLKNPVQNKTLVQHHVPKIILISAGLLLACCLVSSGWYVTAAKLDSYIANDTKYRRMRLDTSNNILQNYLYALDSMYNTNPDLRKIVLEMEEQDKENFERLKQAADLKKQAKALEKKINKR